MVYSTKQQQGLTLISITFILGLIAFFVLLILKIGPIYMNHSKVVNSLAAVENMVDIENKSKFEIERSLLKRFNFNYVDKVGKDDIKVFKQGNYVKVEIEYERVELLAGNLSVLVEFYESFEAGGD
jgi:competence protein ComGC